jgi:hypothetical protein
MNNRATVNLRCVMSTANSDLNTDAHGRPVDFSVSFSLSQGYMSLYSLHHMASSSLAAIHGYTKRPSSLFYFSLLHTTCLDFVY